jgi:hypothetical protein
MLNMTRVVCNPRLTSTLTVKRPSAPSLGNEGLRATPTYTSLTMSGIVQPASTDDLQMLPEGSRLNNVIAVWASQPLYVDNAKDKASDLVIYKSVEYKVMKAADRSESGFYKVLAEGYVRA